MKIHLSVLTDLLEAHIDEEDSDDSSSWSFTNVLLSLLGSSVGPAVIGLESAVNVTESNRSLVPVSVA